MGNVICTHCGEPAYWSRFLEVYWCGDCRTDEVEENSSGNYSVYDTGLERLYGIHSVNSYMGTFPDLVTAIAYCNKNEGIFVGPPHILEVVTQGEESTDGQ